MHGGELDACVCVCACACVCVCVCVCEVHMMHEVWNNLGSGEVDGAPLMRRDRLRAHQRAGTWEGWRGRKSTRRWRALARDQASAFGHAGIRARMHRNFFLSNGHVCG
jgi:hypothetical protein